MSSWAKLTLTLLFAVPSGTLAQQVTCTPDVPKETCKTASAVLSKMSLLALAEKLPIIIADPEAIGKEKKGLMFIDGRYTHIRHPLASQDWSYDNILLEREKGVPCPTRVVISMDEWWPLDLKTLKRTAGFDSDSVFTTRLFIEAFLAGCESGLDY